MDVEKKLAQIERKLHRVEVEVGDIADDFAMVLVAIRRGATLQTHGHTCNPRALPLTPEAERASRARAADGVTALVIDRHADGSAVVRIGEYPKVKLSPTLTDLLECLCVDNGHDDDGLVGFKPAKELGLLLGQRQKRRFTPHNLAQLVFRLRRELRRSDNNHYFVQTQRKRGYRFAVRRRDDCVTGDDAA